MLEPEPVAPRLFIAEDDTQYAHLLARVARAAGWDVVETGNGVELLEALDAWEGGAALALIDIQMPELDGIEVIEHLVGRGRRLRVRFMTGGPEVHALAAKMIASARDLDVGRFLLKPMSVQQIRELLEEERQLLLEGTGQ